MLKKAHRFFYYVIRTIRSKALYKADREDKDVSSRFLYRKSI